MASVFVENEEGVIRESRATPPAHYLFKVEHFLLLSENGVDQIKSNKFQVGGHQWKIVLYPKGNNGGKGDYVSINLMLESTGSIEAGKDVSAIFKFFLFDQIEGKYHTVQGRARRFDNVKYEWGFDKFISLEALKKPSNGLLVNDTWFCGVEVFVSEGSRLGECLSVLEVANICGKYKWEIEQYSKLSGECYSEEFVVGGYTWKLLLYPDGNNKHKDYSLSLFLKFVDSPSSTSEHEVRAEYKLILNDQLNQNHKWKKGTRWFGAMNDSWGWNSFIKLEDFKNSKKGYLVEDRCIIEAEVTVLCETSRKMLNC